MAPKSNNQDPGAVIYTRVSSADQVDGTSLDTQRDTCRACAARLGLPILSEHEDAGKSAKSTVGRDALAAAVAAATKVGATLIIYKFDRLSRNLGDGYELRDMLIAKGCRIISASEGEASASPISKAMYAMMMAFAELDNDMRAERCRTGMRARARQGGWNCVAPVGFNIVRNSAGIAILEPDGVRSEILRTAMLDFVTGKTTKSGLIARLTVEGYPSSTISRIIRNPVYGGIIRNAMTDGEDVTAAFPGLITRDQFYIMESKLRGKRVMLKDNPAFPFTGCVFCATCGTPIRSGFTRSRGNSFGYYWCQKAGHPKIRRDDLHEQVNVMLSKLGQIAPFLELLKKAVNKRDVADPYRSERERHERNISRLEPQTARLRAALLDGTFTRDEYDAERSRITGSLAESRAWLDAHTGAADRRGEYLDLLIGVFSDPAALMERLTVPQIKALVRIVFVKITLTDKKEIEPSQDSVYALLTAVQSQSFQDGGPGGGKFEPGAVFWALIQAASERLAILLREADLKSA